MKKSLFNRFSIKTLIALLSFTICFKCFQKEAVAQYRPGTLPSVQSIANKPGTQTQRLTGILSLPGNSDDYFYQNGWNLGMFTRYTYNAAGQLVTRITKSAYTGQFQDKDTISYDAQGELLYQGSFSWLSNSWVEMYGFKQIITYNSNSQQTEAISLSLKQGIWTNIFKQSTNYNANGKITEKTSYNWRNNNWQGLSKQLYSYGSGSTVPNEIVFQEYRNGVWENKERFVNISWHDFNKMQFDFYEKQGWTNGWIIMSRHSTTYDAFGGSETITQLPGPGNTWVNSQRATITYDNRMNFIGEKSELWQGNMWRVDTDYQQILTYNATDDVTEMISRFWDKPSNSYQNSARSVYHNFIRISGTTKDFAPLNVKLYPNPTSEVLNIQIEGKQAGTILITDLTGKIVLQHNLDAAENRVNIASLAKGTYILKLQSLAGTYNTKIIKE